MKKELSRIEALKEKIDQKKIALDIFGEKEGNFIFLDSISSREIILQADKIAYKNIITRIKKEDDKSNDIIKKFDLMVFDLSSSNLSDISFFVFSEKIYDVTTSVPVFLSVYEKIKNKSSYHDIIIHSKNLNFGLCLLLDEHYISISHWKNNS
ncbi:hypothetical protein [Candidatus Pantoea soli]|uniref:hypothetical protein n=1 Tax=Candidatus Pantoea soli TaxID=3098669 RepID=UPI0011A113D1|nr:hypothetical protein [Pantoea soli]